MDTSHPLDDLRSKFGFDGSVSALLPVILHGSADVPEASALLTDTIEAVLEATVRVRLLAASLNGQAIIGKGGLAAIDASIEWLLAEEHRAAADLHSVEQSVVQLVALADKDTLDTAIEAVRQRCELLRDMRWELMGSRANAQPEDRLSALPLGSLDRLRGMIGRR